MRPRDLQVRVSEAQVRHRHCWALPEVRPDDLASVQGSSVESTSLRADWLLSPVSRIESGEI